MKNFVKAVVEPLVFLLEHRLLVAHSVATELRYRTAGTALGFVWLFLAPLLLLGAYTLVYLVIFRVRPEGMTPEQYVLLLFCGLVPFLGASEGVVAGLGALSTNVVLLHSTVFPVEVLPVRSVIASQTGFTIGIVLLLAAAAFFGKPSAWWLAVPLVMLCQVLALIGLGWMLSLANLAFRDLQTIATYAIMMLLIVTPIAYSPDSLPSSLRFLIWLNPLAYFVLAYQKLLVGGEALSLAHASAIVIFSVALFALGYRLFGVVKTIVTDYA